MLFHLKQSKGRRGSTKNETVSFRLRMSARLKEILEAIPKGWNGTTYPNDKRFIGREQFMQEMAALLQGTSSAALLQGTSAVSRQQLEHMYPEDYLRLGSPLSTLLEVVRALDLGYKPSHVFCFASATFPLIVCGLAAARPIFVYGQPRLLSNEQVVLLRASYGVDMRLCEGPPRAHPEGAVLLVGHHPAKRSMQVRAGEAFVRAGEAFVRAGEAFVRAGEAFVRTGEAFVRVGEAFVRAGEALARAGETFARASEAFVRAGEAFVRAGEAFARAGEAFVRAGEAFVRAGEAFVRAGEAFVRAGEAFRPPEFWAQKT
eukprot:g43798.t1